MTSPGRRRVVVTGLGCVSPLGIDVASTWEGAVAGRSGVGPITRFDCSDFTVRFAGQVPAVALDLGDLPVKEARRLDPVVTFALAAAREAVSDAGLEIGDDNRERVGVSLGTGIGGLQTLQNAHEALVKGGPRRVSPFTIPMTICNMSAGYVAIRHGIWGPNLCHVAACASGTQSIGEAARIIERGDADVFIAGGTEAGVTSVGVSAFASMKALSTRNDEPQKASRPFDTGRDGFVIGEGAAMLILEAYEHATARGANILGEVLGYALTADAMHMATPTENAEGSQRCMKLALADADLSPSDVDYLNAHATSTPLGDASEARAVRSVFGSATDQIPVSATKSMTGHLLGAAGALEAIFCIRALEVGMLPPTINLDKVDPECDLDHVANKARDTQPQIALSNSLGFGGTNASLVLGRAS